MIYGRDRSQDTIVTSHAREEFWADLWTSKVAPIQPEWFAILWQTIYWFFSGICPDNQSPSRSDIQPSLQNRAAKHKHTLAWVTWALSIVLTIFNYIDPAEQSKAAGSHLPGDPDSFENWLRKIFAQANVSSLTYAPLIRLVGLFKSIYGEQRWEYFEYVKSQYSTKELIAELEGNLGMVKAEWHSKGVQQRISAGEVTEYEKLIKNAKWKFGFADRDLRKYVTDRQGPFFPPNIVEELVIAHLIQPKKIEQAFELAPLETADIECHIDGLEYAGKLTDMPFLRELARRPLPNKCLKSLLRTRIGI